MPPGDALSFSVDGSLCKRSGCVESIPWDLTDSLSPGTSTACE